MRQLASTACLLYQILNIGFLVVSLNFFKTLENSKILCQGLQEYLRNSRLSLNEISGLNERQKGKHMGIMFYIVRYCEFYFHRVS